MSRFNPLFTNNIDCNSVITDYCEFSGLKEEIVKSKIEASFEFSANEWEKNVSGNNSQQIHRFYAASDYVCEVLFAYLHPETFYKKGTMKDILKFVKTSSGKNVMEFGGGTGQLCLLMYFNTDKKITYVDLPGRISEFAQWRFKKYNADISIIYSDVEELNLPKCEYDILVSDAVLEHVPNLEQTMKALTESMRQNSKFYLLFDTEYSDRFPMHISANKNIEEIAKRGKLYKIDKVIYVKSNEFSPRLKHALYRSSPNIIKQAITGFNHPYMIKTRIISKTKSF